MKDILDDFKEDLEFLLQAGERRKIEERRQHAKKAASSVDVHDFPDLLHIQSYLYRPGVKAEPESGVAPSEDETPLTVESLIPREESEPPNLSDVWDECVLADSAGPSETGHYEMADPLPEPLRETPTESPDRPVSVSFSDSEPPAPAPPISASPEKPDDRPAVQQKPVPRSAEPRAEAPIETPEREPVHYTPKKKDEPPAWKKLWTSMQGHSLIGVDIGSHALKLVHLRKGAAGFSLSAVSCHEFEPIPEELAEAERVEKRQEQIVQFLKGKFRHLDYITSALTGLEVIYRQLNLPRISKKELLEAVPWAVRKDLPYELDSAALGFEVQKTVKKGRAEKLKVGTVVAPSQLVAEHLQIYQKLGVLPAKLTAVPVAIWNVIRRDKALLQKKVLVVEIGARRSHLVFINQGVLDFHREITTAAQDFIEAIGNTIFYNLDMPQPSQAEAVKLWQTHGIPGENSEQTIDGGIKLSEIGISLRPVLERLINEIRRSIDYYREKFQVESIDCVFISGGSACVPGLQARLADMLNTQVELLNPFQIAGIKKWETHETLLTCAPRFTIAVGLAMDLSGGMNLLPVELQGMHRLHKIKKILRYSALVVAVGIGLSTAFLTLKMQQITAELSHLQTRYIKMEPVRQEFMRLKGLQDQLQQKLDLYRSKIFVNPNAVQHLRAISNLVPPSIALTSVTIAPLTSVEEGEEDAQPQKTGVEKIVLRGIAFPARALEGPNLAEFLLKLKNSGYFQSIEMVGQETQANGAIAFVINCYY